MSHVLYDDQAEKPALTRELQRMIVTAEAIKAIARLG
jgi:hypothetical protein